MLEPLILWADALSDYAEVRYRIRLNQICHERKVVSC